MSYEVVELYDYGRICEMMRKYGDEYTDGDSNVFMVMNKTCYGVLVSGELSAFACIVHHEGQNILTYTWSNGTYRGKKAYAFLSNFILSRYPALFYGEKASKFNKSRR